MWKPAQGLFLLSMHGQEQRSELFLSVCSMYHAPDMSAMQLQVSCTVLRFVFGRHRPNAATITRLQALKESVPASVRRFRELGLMNKGSGPRVNMQAAAKFLQLCFRSMSYGVHSFQTCLLLEQVTPRSVRKFRSTTLRGTL